MVTPNYPTKDDVFQLAPFIPHLALQLATVFGQTQMSNAATRLQGNEERGSDDLRGE